MPKCDFNKVASNLLEVARDHTSAWVFSFIEMVLRHGCSPKNLLHIFRKLFPKNTSGWLLRYILN